ncbi:hypothetical protein DFAR_2880005 [Desulfarculales bacterium]
MGCSCLRCHSQPEQAPAALVPPVWSPVRSFQRQEGKLISAISIRAPLSQTLGKNQQFALKLSALLLAGLGGVRALLLLVHRRFFQGLLEALRRQARAFAEDSHNLGRRYRPNAWAGGTICPRISTACP